MNDILPFHISIHDITRSKKHSNAIASTLRYIGMPHGYKVDLAALHHTFRR